MGGEGVWSEGEWFFTRHLAYAALDRFLRLTRDSEYDAARAWNGSGLAALKLRDYALTRLYLTRSLEAAQASGESKGMLKALINLVNLYFRTGNAKSALALVPEAERLSREVGDPVLTANTQFTVGLPFALEQRWTEAESRFRAALSGLPDLMIPVLGPLIYANLGVCLLDAGEEEEARQCLLRALELGRNAGHATVVSHSCTELARLALKSGEADQAVQYGREALDYLWNHMGDVYKGEVARLCEIFGLLALSMGDRRKGSALLERASTYYGQINYLREWKRVSELQRSGSGNLPRQPGRLPREAISTLDYFSDLFGLLDNIESADPTLSRRGQLVTHYAQLLGAHLGLAQDQMTLLSHAGRLCDIGLTTFEPEAIADEEGPRYKLHPQLSAQWLSDFPLPEGTAAVVRAHHERYDGAGYPDGLRGERIPLGARLLATCETYVRAMQSGSTHDDAMALLASESGAALDPALVEAFTRLHRPSPQ